MILIRCTNSGEADALTHIALAAKRHWGHPESWIEIWTPELTFNAEYFEAKESWAAIADDKPVALEVFERSKKARVRALKLDRVDV